jgi:hypothetical protein
LLPFSFNFSKKQYDTLQKLRRRFTDDWYIIDGEDEKQRDQFFAQYCCSDGSILSKRFCSDFHERSNQTLTTST